MVEVAVDADREARGAGGQLGVEPGLRGRAGAAGPRLVRWICGAKANDQRERRPLGVGDPADAAVDGGLEELAVERDHLPVAGLERAEAEVAVLLELAEGDVAVVGAVEQRVDGGRLEDHVRLVLGVHVAVAHRLDVQGLDQSLVDGHREADF